MWVLFDQKKTTSGQALQRRGRRRRGDKGTKFPPPPLCFLQKIKRLNLQQRTKKICSARLIEGIWYTLNRRAFVILDSFWKFPIPLYDPTNLPSNSPCHSYNSKRIISCGLCVKSLLLFFWGGVGEGEGGGNWAKLVLEIGIIKLCVNVLYSFFHSFIRTFIIILKYQRCLSGPEIGGYAFIIDKQKIE